MSAILLRKSGMPSKWILHHQLINDFYLQPEAINCLDNYYKLYWQPDYFFSIMRDGVIEHQNVRYLVVYQKCNPITIRRAEQIELSFRKLRAEYNLVGYVLVRIPERK